MGLKLGKVQGPQTGVYALSRVNIVPFTDKSYCLYVFVLGTEVCWSKWRRGSSIIPNPTTVQRGVLGVKAGTESRGAQPRNKFFFFCFFTAWLSASEMSHGKVWQMCSLVSCVMSKFTVCDYVTASTLLLKLSVWNDACLTRKPNPAMFVSFP